MSMPRTARSLIVSIVLAVVLLLLQTGTSCVLLDMSPLTITSWTPQDERLGTVSGVTIQVRFSRLANKQLAQQAFSITGDGQNVEGRFLWPDDQTLQFVPDEPLEDFVIYQMRVSGQAEDTQGRDLRPEFAHTFTTKSDYTRPTVSAIAPVDYQSVADQLTPVSIVFSEPMDRASLIAAFAIAPAVRGLLSLSPDGRTLTFTPTERLQWQTRYMITIARSAADIQRNALGADYTSHLFVGTESVAPSILSLQSADGTLILSADDPTDAVMTVASGWESTEGLVVTFSEPVLTSSASAAVQISPSVPSTIREANSEFTSTLTYSFPDRLVYGVTYTVSTVPGVQDAQGNKSIGQAAYHFLVDGAATTPPVITRICYPEGTGDPANNVTLVAYDSLTLPPLTAGEVDSFFDVYVDLAPGAALDPFSIAKAFSVSTTNNAATFASFAVEVGPAQTNPAPRATVNELVARVWVHVTNNASSGQVVIHVSTDLKDNRGTALARELLLPLNDPD